MNEKTYAIAPNGVIGYIDEKCGVIG